MPRTSARITCKNCGAYLGMDEGWYEECESCRNSDTFAAAARQVHKELKTLRGVIFDEAKREYKAIKDKIKRRKK